MATRRAFHLTASLCLASTLQQFQSEVPAFWMGEKQFFTLIDWSLFNNRNNMNSCGEVSTIWDSEKGRCHRWKSSVWNIRVHKQAEPTLHYTANYFCWIAIINRCKPLFQCTKTYISRKAQRLMWQAIGSKLIEVIKHNGIPAALSSPYGTGTLFS